MKIRLGHVANSSSSCFICSTTIELEEIKSELGKILEGYNFMTDSEYNFSDVFNDPFIAHDSYVKNIDTGWGRHYSYAKYGYVIDKKIIEGTEDNSVPHELFDIICNKFDAIRLHV